MCRIEQALCTKDISDVVIHNIEKTHDFGFTRSVHKSVSIGRHAHNLQIAQRSEGTE